MGNSKRIFLIALIALMGCASASSYKNNGKQNKRFAIIENKSENRVDITVDGQPFTSYIYDETLKKPVLYPLRTATGTLITRGWPLEPRAGERVDHPHHVGMWFNYGDANGLDFWNNSNDIPPEKRHLFGTIKHSSLNKVTSDDNHAELEVTKYWQKPSGENLLKEDTRYIFSGKGDTRTIELIVQLTALGEDVLFKDNKEGLLGIRVARELEHPADKPNKFTDSTGKATTVAKMNNEGVTGRYRSSDGKEGDDVWGTRSRWVSLNGKIGEEALSIVILDNPKNVGYPTYWHARGYGLFAANPLGQKEFSKSKEILNYKLSAGESVKFRYKVLIHSGSASLNDEDVEREFTEFSRE